ncbi:MAG TPA: hypothetical protein VL173_09265 [Vicinamibacterales bacterium]|nr:hypothetical protein [Vicinamibacterales bacterium]
MTTARPRIDVPFQAHIELLQLFLTRRDDIVARLERVLNAQRAPIEYLQDGVRLAQDVEDCFFACADVGANQSRLRGQLEEAHWASGFRPHPIAGLHNGPADPAEMMMRAFYLWRQTRWPGRNGRLRYAHTLFNLSVIRCLELLSVRVWDDGAGGAGDRLSQVQGVLDQLWTIKIVDQPVFVRDARWLIQLAQSLATDDLGAYFEIAERVASLPHEDRLVVHAAGVRMAAGHLRSQIRYRSTKDAAPLDDQRLVSGTRTSNALDFALLVQELVPLLAGYEHACRTGNDQKRLELADAICQGISPDPELFVNRVALLGAYSMIEHLFIAIDPEGRATYTPMGNRHVALLEEYEALIGRVTQSLVDDCAHFRPVAGAYSPYGALYGFSSDLIKHMALKASQPDAATNFSLEDVFAAGDASVDKLAWVNRWRKLPHLKPDVQKQFDYPQEFAEDMFNRVEQALRTRTDGTDGARTGRLYVVSEGAHSSSATSSVPDLPVRYVGSSDPEIVSAHKAHACDEPQLLSDRREGKFVVSYRSAGGWVAISKAMLTEVLGTGRDATIAGLPRAAEDTLKLMCRRMSLPGR